MVQNGTEMWRLLRLAAPQRSLAFGEQGDVPDVGVGFVGQDQGEEVALCSDGKGEGIGIDAV